MADVAKIKSLLDQAEVSIRQRPNRPPPDVVTAVATLIAAIRELLVTEKPALKAALPPDINSSTASIETPKRRATKRTTRTKQ